MSGTLSTSFGHSPHPFSAGYTAQSASRPQPADWLFVDLKSAQRSHNTPSIEPMLADPFAPRILERATKTRSTRASPPASGTRRLASSAMASPPPPIVAPVFESQISPDRITLSRPDSGAQPRRRKRNQNSPWDLKHVKAQNPERKGLYTLPEVNEEWEMMKEEARERQLRFDFHAPASPSPLRFQTPSPVYTLSSANASSDVLVPSPRPITASSTTEDTLDEVLTDSDSNPHHVTTPPMEEEDPFSLDDAWTFDVEMRSRQTFLDLSPTRPAKGRRPPPLDLALSIRPQQHCLPTISRTPTSSPRYTDPDAQTGLLSPLPIISPGVVNARRRIASGSPQTLPQTKRRSRELDWQQRDAESNEPIDLESALNEFLTCCGERPSRTERLSGCSTFSSDSENDDLFYLRPESFASTMDREERGLVALAFPLPPSRQSAPPRPARDDDMGLGALSALSNMGVGFGLTFPAEISPSLITPRTPLSLISAGNFASLPLPRSPVVQMTRERSWKPILRSNHSFLQSMSRGEDVGMRHEQEQTRRSESSMSHASSGSYSSFGTSTSSESRGSSRSGRSLPRRAALPEGWKTHGMGRI